MKTFKEVFTTNSINEEAKLCYLDNTTIKIQIPSNDLNFKLEFDPTYDLSQNDRDKLKDDISKLNDFILKELNYIKKELKKINDSHKPKG